MNKRHGGIIKIPKYRADIDCISGPIELHLITEKQIYLLAGYPQGEYMDECTRLKIIH